MSWYTGGALVLCPDVLVGALDLCTGGALDLYPDVLVGALDLCPDVLVGH